MIAVATRQRLIANWKSALYTTSDHGVKKGSGQWHKYAAVSKQIKNIRTKSETK
jgi:hypothetical protein